MAQCRKMKEELKEKRLAKEKAEAARPQTSSESLSLDAGPASANVEAAQTQTSSESSTQDAFTEKVPDQSRKRGGKGKGKGRKGKAKVNKNDTNRSPSPPRRTLRPR